MTTDFDNSQYSKLNEVSAPFILQILLLIQLDGKIQSIRLAESQNSGAKQDDSVVPGPVTRAPDKSTHCKDSGYDWVTSESVQNPYQLQNRVFQHHLEQMLSLFRRNSRELEACGLKYNELKGHHEDLKSNTAN
jgi:hypothetical protein